MENKIKVLGQFGIDEWKSVEPDIEEFIRYHDMSVILSIAQSMGYTKILPEASNIINEAYSNLCKIFGVDENIEFETYDEFIENGENITDMWKED